MANIATLVWVDIRQQVGEFYHISIYVAIKNCELFGEYCHIYTAVMCWRILPDITWPYSTQLLRTCVIPELQIAGFEAGRRVQVQI